MPWAAVTLYGQELAQVRAGPPVFQPIGRVSTYVLPLGGLFQLVSDDS